jgi:hypothetical protein
MGVRRRILIAALVIAAVGGVVARQTQHVLVAQEQAASGYVGYVTKVESDADDVVRLANGAMVEVTSGYLGFIGYRKNAVLLLIGSRCRLWIQGKRSYRCTILRASSLRPLPAVVTSITDVSSDGDIIKTLDGSIFEVDSLSTLYTSLWLPVSEVAVLGNSQMVNLDQSDELATVTRLK